MDRQPSPLLWIKTEKNNDDARDSRRRDVVRRKTHQILSHYTQAPMRTAKAFPSLKIENRVVVRRSTFPSRGFHFLPPSWVNLTLFSLRSENDSFYAFGKSASVLQISCH